MKNMIKKKLWDSIGNKKLRNRPKIKINRNDCWCPDELSCARYMYVSTMSLMCHHSVWNNPSPTYRMFKSAGVIHQRRSHPRFACVCVCNWKIIHINTSRVDPRQAWIKSKKKKKRLSFRKQFDWIRRRG